MNKIILKKFLIISTSSSPLWKAALDPFSLYDHNVYILYTNYRPLPTINLRLITPFWEEIKLATRIDQFVTPNVAKIPFHANDPQHLTIAEFQHTRFEIYMRGARSNGSIFRKWHARQIQNLPPFVERGKKPRQDIHVIPYSAVLV